MMIVTRRLEWDALHRIPEHEGRCRAFHGHRYIAEISCSAPELDSLGRVIDFGVIKERVGGFIDQRWDHSALLMRGDPDPAIPLLAQSNAAMGRPVYWMENAPTAENIALELKKIAEERLSKNGIQVVRVRIWETPNVWAEWQRESLL